MKKVRFLTLVLTLLLCLFVLTQPIFATEKTYQITYDANGGTNAPASQTKTHNVALILCDSVPERWGHVFRGWASTPYGNVKWQPGGTCDAKVNQDMTLYAVWSKICESCKGVGMVTKTCTDCGGAGYRYETVSSCCKSSYTETIVNGAPSIKQCRRCGRICNTQSLKVDCAASYWAACNYCDKLGYTLLSMPDAPKPEVSETTSTRITLVPTEGIHYALVPYNGNAAVIYQSSNVFKNLTPNTKYTIWQYYPGNDYYYEGASSPKLYVTTPKNLQEAPPAPTSASQSYNSILLEKAEGCEYSKDGTNWQKDPKFTGLKPKTEYTFYQRKCETNTEAASEPSPALKVYTLGYGAFSVSSASGKQGDTVKFTVMLTENTGITTLKLRISYYPYVLQFVEIADAGLLTGCRLEADEQTGVIANKIISWKEPATNNTKTGKLLTLTFKIKDDAPLFDSSVIVSVDESYNKENTSNHFEQIFTKVTVSCAHTLGAYTQYTNQHARKCSKCNWQEVEDHFYGTACSSDCTTCGYRRTVKHSYSPYWRQNETEHWNECTSCGVQRYRGAHTPGPEATETSAQKCTTCEYVLKAPLEHTHTPASRYAFDDWEHWYSCQGCPMKLDCEEHDFQNACDKDCSSCGYTRETVHIFDITWSSDAKIHWHACVGCGLKNDEANHTPGSEATEDTAQYCIVCQYEITPPLGLSDTPLLEGDEAADDITGSGELTEAVDAPEKTDDVSQKKQEANSPWLWIVITSVVIIVNGCAMFFVMKRKKN